MIDRGRLLVDLCQFIVNCFFCLHVRYMLEIVEGELENVSKNPEVIVDLQRSNAVVEQQVLQLKLITGKLQNAYAGQDVNWIETGNQSSGFLLQP